MELPLERAQPGYCCRLKRCVYDTRDAPRQWERFAAAALERLGFRRGSASAVRFHHASRDITGPTHGDDFVLCGADADLDWVAAKLSEDILLKVVGKLGGDKHKGDVQEVRCLNRISRWLPNGLVVEADPRHAELLAAMLGPAARPLSAPGAREPGQSRERAHGPGAGPASAGVRPQEGRASP